MKVQLPRKVIRDKEIQRVFGDNQQIAPRSELIKPEPIQPRRRGFGYANCRRCGKPFPKRSYYNLYCVACTLERAKEEANKPNRDRCQECGRSAKSGIKTSLHSGKNLCFFCLERESKMLRAERKRQR